MRINSRNGKSPSRRRHELLDAQTFTAAVFHDKGAPELYLIARGFTGRKADGVRQFDLHFSIEETAKILALLTMKREGGVDG